MAVVSQILRRAKDASFTVEVEDVELPGNVTSYEDEDIDLGVEYFYKVAAIDGNDNQGPFSNVDSATEEAPIAIEFIVAAERNVIDDTGIVTAAVDTTGANLLVAAVGHLNGNTPSVVDSKGNTWTAGPTYQAGAGNGRVALFYCLNPASVGSGHSWMITGSESYTNAVVGAFSGVGAFDDENGAGQASATTQQPGSLTPANDNSLLVTALQFVDTGGAGDASINSGFTLAGSNSHGTNFAVALAYKIQTTAGAENPTWTSPAAADRMAATIAAFEPA